MGQGIGWNYPIGDGKKGRLFRPGQELSAVVSDQFRRRSGALRGGVRHAFDDCAADDRAVGDGGELGEVFGFRDAKTDADGAGRHRFYFANVGPDVGGKLGPRAGDAGDGEIVDEAGAEGGDFFSPRWRRGRGDEKIVARPAP